MNIISNPHHANSSMPYFLKFLPSSNIIMQTYTPCWADLVCCYVPVFRAAPLGLANLRELLTGEDGFLLSQQLPSARHSSPKGGALGNFSIRVGILTDGVIMQALFRKLHWRCNGCSIPFVPAKLSSSKYPVILALTVFLPRLPSALSLRCKCSL
jgi:hypothetical protein